MTRSFPAAELIDRLVDNAELPSLGLSVSRVAKLADSQTSTLSELANLILSDVYLTQKVLRLANSVMFRRAAPPVTTVSRAIARIGSEQVRLISLSALLLERMANREKAARLSPELLKALYASMLAHSIASRSGIDSEEAAICAMFRSIGRLMIAMYETDCLDEINRVVDEDRVSEAEAMRLVTGSSFEAIGQHILGYWGMPDLIVKTVAVYPPGGEMPRGKLERLQLVSQFSTDVAGAVRKADGSARARGLANALRAYGNTLGFDSVALQDLVEATSERTRSFARALDLDVGGDEVSAADVDRIDVAGEADAARAAAQASGMPGRAGGVGGRADPANVVPDAGDATAADAYVELLAADAALPTVPVTRSPEGKPSDSTSVLLSGIQDMTTGVAEGHGVSSVLNIALETLYRGLGYRRAVLCLRDPQAGLFRARIHFGAMTREQVTRFAFAMTPGSDLFWSVMQRNVDVHIRDLSAPTIQSALPAWYRDACADAKSFLLLAIGFNQKPLGFFYADRPVVDAIGLTAEELGLVRMLKSQTQIALRTSAGPARPAQR